MPDGETPPDTSKAEPDPCTCIYRKPVKTNPACPVHGRR